ncbi:hypothetical protein [Polaromonas sp. JS666]|uniref:hypothetical protein n=1 Tax=Polaromonas sp. (strain JS666 / ATCC BAA-500) TaxID=296591 RepID=UPI0000D5B474|nr:hypothetical protein [Polaromonas sp. JS666]ABE46678.1 hypothetical protein Bpro_4799 [Polaromonas sp. JS666]
MSDYFSKRENGPRARTEQVILLTVWGGLLGTVQALINSGAFGTFDVAGSIMQRAAHVASNAASNAASGICFS